MAFDQPLEADRVELNLLSAFIRVPIVGGLMWLVAGGDERKKRGEQTRTTLKTMQQEHTDETRIRVLNNEIDHSLDQSMSDDCDQKSLSRSGPKSPRLVSSEVSVSSIGCGEGSELSARQELGQACCDSREPAPNNGKIKKKMMSWSESLVEYFDGSVKHEPIDPSSGFEKPIKSALIRTTSIRTNATELKRYLPKGMDRRHDGIKMPKAPYSTSGSSTSGIESPQWGWYISMTPPTPEMYNRQSTLSVETIDSYVSDSSSRIEEYKERSKPNSVFQNMREANRAPRGWPSVPL